MKAKRQALEDQLEDYEEQLKSLHSYVKELETMTTKHGTDKAQFVDDVIEAEHNIKYYEALIAVAKAEMGGSKDPEGPKSGGTGGSSRIPKPGLSSVIFSSLGFIAGAIFGSKRARKADKDSN